MEKHLKIKKLNQFAAIVELPLGIGSVKLTGYKEFYTPAIIKFSQIKKISLQLSSSYLHRNFNLQNLW